MNHCYLTKSVTEKRTYVNKVGNFRNPYLLTVLLAIPFKINYPAQDGEKSNLTCPMSKSNGAAPQDVPAKEVLANGKAKTE